MAVNGAASKRSATAVETVHDGRPGTWVRKPISGRFMSLKQKSTGFKGVKREV